MRRWSQNAKSVSALRGKRHECQEEAEDILDNIQPPLTLEDIDEKAEMVARALTRNRIGFYALGMGVGAVTGYFIAKRRLQTKYAKIADDEIAEMREHYQAKSRAPEAEAAKRSGQGYRQGAGIFDRSPKTEAPPMAVQPPVTVVETEDEDGGEPPNYDPERPENSRNLFQEAEVTHEWDWHEERKRRSPDIPYVIHYRRDGSRPRSTRRSP